MNEPQRLLDAENIVIPFLRAKFDGDPTHDKITWLIQVETHVEARIGVTPESIEMGVVKRTYMIGLLEVTGIMFNVKDQVPEMFLKDQNALTAWAEKAHSRFVRSLVDQMSTFIRDTNKTREDLVKLHRTYYGVDIS